MTGTRSEHIQLLQMQRNRMQASAHFVFRRCCLLPHAAEAGIYNLDIPHKMLGNKVADSLPWAGCAQSTTTAQCLHCSTRLKTCISHHITKKVEQIFVRNLFPLSGDHLKQSLLLNFDIHSLLEPRECITPK